ncbi:MAG: hypothetical protein WCO04_00710 [Pseudomonadota bacterium]
MRAGTALAPGTTIATIPCIAAGPAVAARAGCTAHTRIARAAEAAATAVTPIGPRSVLAGLTRASKPADRTEGVDSLAYRLKRDNAGIFARLRRKGRESHRKG